MNEKNQSLTNILIGMFNALIAGLYANVIPTWVSIGLGLCGAILILSEIWKIGNEVV